MAESDKVSAEVLEQIHFDTLWAQVQATLQTYAGLQAGEPRWSDFSEHDPGVTMLEALSYVTSDVSYRHTLPLVDLLTPKDQKAVDPVSETDSERRHVPAAGSGLAGGIFAPVFGPERALTCGPVTLDDYRRALLDLTVSFSGSTYFCFDDVQMQCEQEGEGYRYSFDAATLEFRFPVQPAPGDYVIRGGYQLWVVRNAMVPRDLAQTALDRFFGDHRNLCESPPTVSWLEPFPVPLSLTLEVMDDFVEKDAPALMAKLALEVDGWFRPPVQRARAGELRQQGQAGETIYTGPRLAHGWITQLPPVVDYTTARTVDLRPLAGQLQTLTEIAYVADMHLPDQKQAPVTVRVGAYPLVWGKPDGTIDTAKVIGQLLLRKQGQALIVTKDALDAELTKLEAQRAGEALRDEVNRSVPYGNNRALERYVSALSLLPACYGLQQVWKTPDAPESASSSTVATVYTARQLLLYLLPFEQWLANRCDQLAKLWQVLSFDRRNGDDPGAPGPFLPPVVWGAAEKLCEFNEEADEPAHDNAKWILDEFSGRSGPVNARTNLERQVVAQARDNEKELAILDYLLGYFGEQRAERTLLQVIAADGEPGSTPDSETEFRWVQQGYLRQITELGYGRAAINVSRASALQRRIAARLGVGSELFQEKKFTDFTQALPFYLIEHRELLPAAPSIPALQQDWQFITAAEVDAVTPPTQLKLTVEGATWLAAGQLVDLRPHHDADPTAMPILANVIHTFDKGSNQIIIDLKQQGGRLAVEAKTIAQAYKDHHPETAEWRWQWKLSPVWLRRRLYTFAYTAAEVDGVVPSHLTPKGVHQRVLWVRSFPDVVIPGVSIHIQHESGKPAPDQYTGKVIDIDAAAGCLLVEADITWPDDNVSRYQWKWAAPYDIDLFAMTVSVVLPRDFLPPTKIADPLAIDTWVRQVIAKEVPSHMTFQLHWLNRTDYDNFARYYRQWQADGRGIGDLSNKLLDLLAIGYAPVDDRLGVSFVHIVGDETGPDRAGKGNTTKWIVTDKDKKDSVNPDSIASSEAPADVETTRNALRQQKIFYVELAGYEPGQG
ncbi:hypothetical protein [Paraburkholderia aspalathi]|uniref:hypothetical protein n=1 Tax=Paraburkholderia aspalathi TaxID=1324617 RepID=UPI0038BCD057